MKYIKTEDAAGHVLCHDITRIIPGQFKGAAFRKGHIVTEEDIPVLLSMGKENLYVWEKNDDMLHEDEAAFILAGLCLGGLHDGGEGLVIAGEPKEGKIEIKAAADGLLKVNDKMLRAVNSIGEMMIATRHGNFTVRKGQTVAAMRIIPLVIEKEKMDRAKAVCRGAGEGPILRLLTINRLRTAVIVTGNEVAAGRIEDSFGPAVEKKLAEYGITPISKTVVTDDAHAIKDAVLKAAEEGAQMVLCTGGMSVDPDDRTPGAIRELGAKIITYGAPVLPGAMFLLAYYSPGNGIPDVPVMGLPGCVMYAERTVFDLILPRVLAKDKIDDIEDYGQGGLCLGCKICVFPECGFGK